MEEINPNQASKPTFMFRKERDFGEIISDSFTFFNQNKKILTQIFIKFIGPFLLLTIIASTFYQYKTGDLFADISIIGTNTDYFFGTFAENFLIMIFFLLTTVGTTIITYATVLHCIKSYISNNGQIVQAEVSQGVKQDFFKILGFTILAGLVTLVGFALCFLPGVYLYVVLAPGVALVIMEDISVSDAFSKCFTLIKENWWITFATFLVFGILISILGFIFQLPATIYTLAESFLGIQQSSDPSEFAGIYQDWIYLLFSAIAVLGQYFLNIFSVILTALIYFNLSEKQEFRGTYEQIDQIGN